MLHYFDYFKMKNIYFAIITFSTFLPSLCDKCPAIYQRYSRDHSYCKSRNSECPIYYSGVTNAEKKQILDIHNEFRSLVARGEEKRAGGLPAAADMLQMVWDKELAAIAQKRAEQCIYDHDCKDCRRVENFPVGQNIAFREYSCKRSGNCKISLSKTPDWKGIIKKFYDEVDVFDKKKKDAMAFSGEKNYGHFTQIVWSKTWRIGCGFVAYKKKNGYRHFYVCNYGPSGNTLNARMYKDGTPCSSCPVNSYCGRSSKSASYEGLCKMKNDNEAPIYRPEKDYIFHCDFSSTIGDCSTSANGPGKWKRIKALGGYFTEIVLRGGEKSAIKFKKSIEPKENFCLIVKYRSGPTVDGKKNSNKAAVNFDISGASSSSVDMPKVTDKQIFTFSIDLNWSKDTKVSFAFSVPKGEPAQYFNIHMVAAKRGKCKEK